MSFTYPHYASQSPVASYQSAHSITRYMGGVQSSHHHGHAEDLEANGADTRNGESSGRARRGSHRAPSQSHHSRPVPPSMGKPWSGGEEADEQKPLLAGDSTLITRYGVPGIGHTSENESVESTLRAESSDDEYEEAILSDYELHTSVAWRKEAGIILRYTLPIFITQLLEYSLSIAAVISIGHLSTIELAASTLGSMTSAVTGYSIIVGMVSALDSLLPQAWGGNVEQRRLVGLWSQRMAVVVFVTQIPIIAIWMAAEDILLFLRQDPEVAALAATYLRWISLGLPAYSVNTVIRRYYQSQGLLHVPTIIVMIVAPINAVLNYILVWGPGPFSGLGLGFIGAPIATAFSLNLSTILFVSHAILWAPREAWSPITKSNMKKIFSGEALGFLVKLGISGVGQTASEWWSWELIGLAASMLGPVSLAAQSVLLVSASTSYQASFSISSAASVRIGNLIGAGHAEQAKVSSYVSFLLSFVTSGISCTIFLAFRKSWGYLFNGDIEVVSLVATVLPLVGLFQITDGMSAMIQGVLRVTGRQFIGAMMNLVGYYVIGIPIGIVITFYIPGWNLGLLGLWIGLSIALACVSVIGGTLCLRTDWRGEVKRAQDRLRSGGDTGVTYGH
ncbi:hypothetical protein FRC03_006608 [Tulasnella sp. 419]|nr:hypothetical protein FRC03_006608 [Tulasnella sp. 419]